MAQRRKVTPRAKKPITAKDILPKVEKAEATVIFEEEPPNELGYTQEPNYIAVEIEQLNYSSQTGKKTSTPYPQSFDTKEWPAILKFLPSQGFSFLKIINLPEGEEAPPLTVVRG